MQRVLLEPALTGPAQAPKRAADRRGPFRPRRLVSTRARLRGPLVAHMFQAGDVVAVLAADLAARALAPPQAAQAPFFAAPLALVAGLALFRAYGFGRRESLPIHLGRLAVGACVAAAVTALALYPFVGRAGFQAALAAWFPISLAALAGLHCVWWFCVRRWREDGRLTPNIVVVGATGAAARLIAAGLKRREVNILGVFDDRAARAPGQVHGVPVLGDTEALVGHRIMPYVDRIVITVPSRARTRVGQLIERLAVLPNEIALLLDGQDPAYEAAAISRVADVPLARICGHSTNDVRAVVKRTQDLALGALALALAAPVMALIALAVRLDSPGPAMFRQRRHGFNNEEIVVWKFRSMRVETADATASRQVCVGDDRVTRVGRFIRRTSLDELPQLINVLTGEMSLVGPRPHAVGMRTGDVQSAKLVAEYAHRHRMKPGLTGWAAINGSRGPVDTPELVRRRVALDIEYIERQSFWLDLYIMAMTLPCLVGDRQAVR
ncbi:exopolysaccharide biosynthesis polyprenyl glycosylphosphotransferase [Phenylobacterium sp.]|uniref:exopolysaccharide biosynthesis polyprenyl glycosylphosphotransferase n=1 Tax=Phenylobacterium sp. TaxID=1871053 RepID=UPI002F3FCB6A